MFRPAVQLRRLGLREYAETLTQMQRFSAKRDSQRLDEFWLVQHYPVFTLGRNAKPEHILDPGEIPVIKTDRGGQVTYHGPGQMVVYLLLDVRRLKLGVRQMISAVENAVIHLLSLYDLAAYARVDAPGVYMNEQKIAALGLRIKNGKSYHGVSLNVEMDLTPFDRINPCGMAGLKVVQLADFIQLPSWGLLESQLLTLLAQQLGFDDILMR